MGLKAWNIVVGVCSLVVATGACGVDYSSLGDSPENQGAGGGGSGGSSGGGKGGSSGTSGETNGGAGVGGSAGGAPVDPVCGTPNPMGCGVTNACAPGQRCVESTDGVCRPSACGCAAPGSDEWNCTADCGGGQCVAGLPALASAGRLARGCGPADQGYVGLVVGMTERSCSVALALPALVLPFEFLGDDGRYELGTHEFTRAELGGAGAVSGGGSIAQEPYGVGDYLPPEPASPIKIERGSITLRTWDGGELIAGSYDVVLADGSRLAGEFDADICSADLIICG